MNDDLAGNLCECCERDTATTICLDVEANAVLLCIDCQDLLTENPK